MTALVLDAIALVETAELPVLDFVAPIPGFPGERRFVLVSMDEAGLLYSLRSVDRPELRFLVAPPAPFFPDYSVDVDDETLEELDAVDADELLVLLMINAGERPGEASANLMAPIILARRTRRAVQLVLGRTGLPVRAPLFLG
ncbi:flagellar assembly protein FliW [Planosporangium flavigriseum]|uniref:Flagellar assembly factor FliW n=1 Tax=Planosporangium flavigriseum TaxID=373681 RepID=A0A8J3LZC2_9ACTN|nr:flagellar assembly protein FliW [Planosporangium flavigriseum]NJC67220.1 flagellar assembly protein FliW [Planosporangium flavigriseum]GIG76150.1 flagellar assembly factor FliW [Planosporangium flavigriseum]